MNQNLFKDLYMKKESLVVTFNLTFRNIDEVLCYSNSYIDSLNPSELEKNPTHHVSSILYSDVLQEKEIDFNPTR